MQDFGRYNRRYTYIYVVMYAILSTKCCSILPWCKFSEASSKIKWCRLRHDYLTPFLKLFKGLLEENFKSGPVIWVWFWSFLCLSTKMDLSLRKGFPSQIGIRLWYITTAYLITMTASSICVAKFAYSQAHRMLV